MTVAERLLRRFVPFEDMSWEHEIFIRFTLIKTRWFRVFIHKIHGPTPPETCHDHPWSFISIILTGGYWETTNGTNYVFRRPGSVLYRRAEFHHTVRNDKVAWTLVLTGPYRRGWQGIECATGRVLEVHPQ